MTQQLKRKTVNEFDTELNVKRLHKLADVEPIQSEDTMMQEQLPPRPTTPPLGMTLSHYDPNTKTYTSSQYISHHEIKSPICTGMTPVYRAPFERWGSCLI